MAMSMTLGQHTTWCASSESKRRQAAHLLNYKEICAGSGVLNSIH